MNKTQIRIKEMLACLEVGSVKTDIDNEFSARGIKLYTYEHTRRMIINR